MNQNVFNLHRNLRDFSLLVNCEQAVLRALNIKVENQFSDICKLTWICRHEQEILRQFISSDRAVSPENCCQLVSSLSSSEFVEAHKVLNQYAAELVQIYKLLVSSPRAVANFLNSAEKICTTQYTIDELVLAVFNVLYGSCVFPENEKNVLELLGHLISLQLIQSPDPRRLLRKGISSFSRIYKCFSEGLFSNKVFLTAALHDPIMFLLSQDELFLDIDPSKSPIRLPANERRRRFGVDENSKSYKEKVAQHRRTIVEKLVLLTDKFITSILNAMPSFPRSINWLVGQMYTALIEKKLISKEEAALICTDLIFTYFLCSAIINPEPLGIISDTPISHIARFNLMQVGQILQTLAILPYEQRFPAYFGEILSLLNKDSMIAVMNTILNSESASIETIFPVHVPDSNGVEMFRQPAFLGTLPEINILQFFLKSPAIDEISDAALRKNLKNMLKRLPEEFADQQNRLTLTPERTPSLSSNRLKSLADKVQTAASRGHQRLMQTSSVSNLRNLHQRANLTNSASNNVLAEESSTVESQGRQEQTQIVGNKHQNILIFRIPERNEPIGMASEEEIMELFRRLQSKRRKLLNGEKKTRFLTATESIVSDRTATDVVSDEEEEEGLDEAAADASVSSSSNENAADEEVEDISALPDNFSDVVPISANVSARGSPSLSGGRVSGRETPFSAGNAPEQNNEESTTICSTIPAIATQPAEPRRNLPTIPVTVRKQNTEGLEEKFGKFGLPPQDPTRYRDETTSLVSDSWSTDVVASDNEGLSELRAAEPPPSVPAVSVAHSPIIPPAAALVPIIGQHPNPGQPRPQSSNPNRQGVGSQSSTGPSSSAHLAPQEHSSNGPTTLSSAHDSTSPTANVDEEHRPYYDPANLLRCKAFLDAKRKLRLVLSCTTNLPFCSQSEKQQQQNGDDKKLTNGTAKKCEEAENELAALQQFLELLLAESINGRDRKQSSQIREVQRCLSIFDQKGIRTLLRTMREDQRKRTYYQLYLQTCKNTLLQLEFCLERVCKRIRLVKSVTAECLIEMLVQYSLQKKDQFLRQFVYDFQQLNVQDEKIDLVESHLSHLCEGLVLEPMWRFATFEHLEYARKCLERSLMAHIYHFAFFPNGEADYYRDEVFHKSIQCLSGLITVEHPELALPKNLHAECPWPSAQAELNIINAYKSPRDKMACITRCCETIENLVILSSGRGTASADDILPILVFVILKANPPALLSNLQFIDGFYAKRMQGGEAYWWIQITSAVEFLKTLLNKLCN